jgi:hypothetical protein
MDTKLNEIKRTTEKWNNPVFLKRRDEVILNRLRIGHTYYTHANLMKKEPPKICHTCGHPTSIKLIITECRDTQEARIKHNIPEHLHGALGPDI